MRPFSFCSYSLLALLFMQKLVKGYREATNFNLSLVCSRNKSYSEELARFPIKSSNMFAWKEFEYFPHDFFGYVCEMAKVKKYESVICLWFIYPL